MADENKIPLPVRSFIYAVETAERNPFMAITEAFRLDVDPTPYILPRDRALFASRLLKLANRVIIDPYQESVLHGRLRDGFHANWVLTGGYDQHAPRSVSSYGPLKTVHFRLHVDECRFRYYQCTSCRDPFGIGTELTGKDLEALKYAIFSSLAWYYLLGSMDCVSSVIYNDDAGVFERNVLCWQTTGGCSLAVINHAILGEIIYDYITPYMELVEEVRPRVILRTRRNPNGRTAAVRAVRIERALTKTTVKDTQLASLQIDLHEIDLRALPYDLKQAFQWTERWYYIVHWEDPDIASTKVLPGGFYRKVMVHSTADVFLGDVVVHDIFVGLTRPRKLRHPNTFSRFVEQQIARQDEEEEKERTKRLQAKARAALEQQRQEDAMYQSDSFVAMQLESTDEEGDE